MHMLSEFSVKIFLLFLQGNAGEDGRPGRAGREVSDN